MRRPWRDTEARCACEPAATEEFYDRWDGTLTSSRTAPMTVIWGTSDPIAVEAMADRIKLWRPATDVCKLSGVGHWPSLEAPAFITDAILHRLPSV